jgi:hypothetical protein
MPALDGVSALYRGLGRRHAVTQDILVYLGRINSATSCALTLCSTLLLQCSQLPPDDRRPRSYSHLLFKPTLVRFPTEGLGVPGSEKMDAVGCAPRGLGEPSEDLRFPLDPPLNLDGLFICANGDPFVLPPTMGLPLADNGELV